MTFYRLKKRYALRGWERLPHAVTDTQTGNTTFVDEMTFQALSFCNGRFDVDNPAVLPAHKEIILKLKEKAVVEECTDIDGLEDGQKYKLFPCRFIRISHWSITGKCNYRCRHCYMSAPEAKYGELSHEQCLNIIEQLSAAGIAQVSLTGGEPLVRRDFLDIIDALLAKKIVVRQIFSNGALVNDKLLDQLARRGVRPEFSVSFDGVGCHDWLRGIAGAEKSAIDALKLLQERDFPTAVEMSLHKGNLHTLEETVNLLASLGVGQIKATPTSDSGAWIKERGKYTLGVQELYAAYLEYIPKYKAAGAPVGLMLGGFFMCDRGSENYRIPCKKFDGSEKMLQQPLCGSARNTMYIAADGKLLPCIPLAGMPIQDEMPNILETGLLKALSYSTYFRAIDSRLGELLAQNKQCGGCEHKLYCGGGCRAAALVAKGEYFGCDEYTCHFFKNGYEDKIKAIY